MYKRNISIINTLWLPLSFIFLLFHTLPLPGDEILVSRFQLPFKDKDARFFFAYQDSLYFGDNPSRTLYKLNQKDTLEKVEDLSGWYIVDAWPFQKRIYYCSRQRILYKEAGKVRTIPIDSSESLISITADPRLFYLLDERKDGYYILTVDINYKLIKEFPCPGRQPSDIVYYKNALWIYDIKNRSVQKYNLKTEEVDFIIYTGADNCYSKGILFFKDQLYVHNRGSSSLDLVMFKETDKAVLSLPHTITYQYKIESKNLHKTKSCTTEFRIPIPRDSLEQQINNLQWHNPPGEMKNDLYDQPLAYFYHTIPPEEQYLLSYKADCIMWAVHYKVKETPLSALSSIPVDIKKEYLKKDSYFNMDATDIKNAAHKARLNTKGKEPQGVKELIENIADFIITALSYTMDDNWDKPDIILDTKQGSCSEYSFLFSALARLNNIPTRMAGGFIFESEADSFHRWTEVYYPGLGWVPVDVTAIDSDDPESMDYEFLFGKPHTRIIFSLMGGIDNTALDVEYYGYKRYSGGTRERKVTVDTIVMEPFYNEKIKVVNIKKP